MILQEMSDLHLEMDNYEWDIPVTDADVVILAGDIGVGVKEIEWALDQEKKLGKPIIMIAGNHTYYHQDFDTLLPKYREMTKGTNVHFLENDTVIIDGIAFLGCTLWTDFDGIGFQERAMIAAPTFLNDYRIIDKGERILTPADTKAKFDESRKFLDFALEANVGKPTVVVTHHGPSMRCHDGKKYGSPDDISVNFWSDLDYLIETYQPKIWVYGHTHSSIRFKLGKTRIVSNQRGYGRECPDFDPNYTVKV